MLETKNKNYLKKDMNKNKDILFFSKFCNHCNKFNERLEKSSNIKNETLFFCIDNNREKIPSFIKAVPSLLTKDKQIISGKQLFDWLENKISSQVSDDPMAWHNNEMGAAFSDHYSFLDSDTSAEGTGGNSIAHNFSFLNNNSSGLNPNQIRTPQDSQQTVKKDPLTQRMEAFVAARDSDMPQQIHRI